MGQLEKYGLYVLCLVIFLILGVTIWGGGDTQLGRTPPASIRSTASGPSKAATGAEGAPSEQLKSFAEALLDGGGESAGGGKDGGGTGRETGKAGEPKNEKPEPANPAKGETPPPVKPPVRAVYTVQEGDTFESIARSKLGKASLCSELMKQNPGIEPKKLRPGMELALPDATALAVATKVDGKVAKDAKESKRANEKLLTPPADGTRTYVVKKGDTFERIAVAELGSKRRTSELLELNAGLDPTKLKLGMSLKLPTK